MSFMIIWILQMLVFFLFISAVVFFFSKRGSGTTNQNRPNQENRQQRVEKEWVSVKQRQPVNESQARNTKQKQHKSAQSERNGQQYKDRKQKSANHKAERLKNRRLPRIEPAQKPVLQHTVALKNTKKQSKSAPFKGSNLKQAMIYKEILDKPLSLREE